MSTAVWVTLYVIQAVWWLWIARWGGARVLEGWRATLLVDPLAWRWDADMIKVFAWLSLLATTFWFLLGLVEPTARGLYP
jgi:hypothetical protein